MTWTQITLPAYLEGSVAFFLFNTLHNHHNIPLLENTASNNPQFYHHYYNKRFTNYQTYFLKLPKFLFQIITLMHNSFIFQQYVCYTVLLNMFRAARCSSSGGQIVSPQPLVSSPSVNSRTVCRWRADCSSLSTCILYGCLQRVTIPEAVVIQSVLLRMSSVLLETC